MAGPDFGKQIGPLPLGAWVVLVGGGLAIAAMSSRRSAATSVEMTDTSGGYSGVGVGGTPAYTYVGNSTPIVAEQIPESNEEWGRLAIDGLISRYNYDPSLVTSAITKYLSGEDLSASEMTIVAAAIRNFKSPPSALVPRVAAPAPKAKNTWAPGFYAEADGTGGFQLDAAGNLDLLTEKEYIKFGSPQVTYIARDSQFWNDVNFVGELARTGWKSSQS